MKKKGITIQFFRVREEDYECDLCCKNKAHISITFNRGYAIAVCKECFDSFGETKALFILEGIEKNRSLRDIKISREIWKKIGSSELKETKDGH